MRTFPINPLIQRGFPATTFEEFLIFKLHLNMGYTMCLIDYKLNEHLINVVNHSSFQLDIQRMH